MENEKTINFWLSSDDEKRDAYFKIKEKLNVSPKAAEKDWWVSHVIKAVFSLDCAEALTFKGGTSLSKAWGITQRFSEDVDISIDKSFFGLSGDTRSSRDRIRKLSRKYIQEVVRDELRGLVYVYGGDKYVWDDVAEYILLLSKPAYYRDAVVKHGYMRGTETYAYVTSVRERFEEYSGQKLTGNHYGAPEAAGYAGVSTEPTRRVAKTNRFQI